MNITNYMPFVIEKHADGERSYDLASALLKERIILIDSGVDTNLAHVVSAQLLHLESQSSEDITMWINSPGGSVHDGLKIADTMELIRCDVRTICSGLGASMGCYLTSLGTPGKRYMTKRATLMAHQVSSGTQGLITDQEISLEHSKHLNKLLLTDLADRCGVTYAKLKKDIDRDFWMTCREARDYGKTGFIDAVILNKDRSTGQTLVEYRGGKVEPL